MLIDIQGEMLVVTVLFAGNYLNEGEAWENIYIYIL